MQRRALMEVLLQGLRIKYGTYSARRIIIEVGGIQKMKDIPDAKVEAVITECYAVVQTLSQYDKQPADRLE